MSNIFFTADTHYGHTNIASKEGSQWKAGWRDFKNVKDMNWNLINQINKIVGPDDTLYHLGDWSFGGIENIWKFRSQIACQNIHLILGNHDHHIEENKFLSNVSRIFTESPRDLNNPGVLYDGPILDGVPQTSVSAKELFSSISHYKEIKTSAGIIVLSHYGHRVWHGSHKGWIHLYGHSHGSLPPYGKSIDVGVDSAKRILGEYRPFYLSEIVNIMKDRSSEFPDHHDSETNTGKVK